MAERRSKHRDVYRAVRHDIESARFAPGQRLPTERELLERFGVSRPTVIRALNDLRSDGLIDRRQGSGSFVRDAAPDQARAFGFMLPNMFPNQDPGTNVFNQILDAMVERARDRGYAFVLSDLLSESDPERLIERTRRLTRQFISQRLKGVFLTPLELSAGRGDHNTAILDALAAAGIPVVLLDRQVDGYEDRLDWVGIDNMRAGELIANHLVEIGCRHPHFISEIRQSSSVSARLEGFANTLAERGIRLPEVCVHRVADVDAELLGRIAADPTVDALVCRNDGVAAAAMRGLLAAGVDIPGRLRLASFDDSPAAALLPVPLTSIHQPARHIGTAAVDLLLGRIADPTAPARCMTIAAKLVVRESTVG